MHGSSHVSRAVIMSVRVVSSHFIFSKIITIKSIKLVDYNQAEKRTIFSIAEVDGEQEEDCR